MDECTKQSILGGMCKKHYDEVNVGSLENGAVKAPTRAKAGLKESDTVTAANGKDDIGSRPKRGGHQRGLSLFQDGNVMDTVLNNVPTTSPLADNDGLHGLSI